MKWIHLLRLMAKSNPDEFARITEEYYSMKTRAFCTKYRIGVTGAVALFWRKKPPVITELVGQRDIEEIDVEQYVSNVTRLEDERKAMKASRYRPGDIDEYYNRSHTRFHG